MRGEEIQRRILECLEDMEWPSTAGDIAKCADISGNTAELHLVKLQMQGKIKFRKVGRQNQWWLNKNYKKNLG